VDAETPVKALPATLDYLLAEVKTETLVDTVVGTLA